MNQSHPASYIGHVERLEKRLQQDDALRHAVGGEFLATGKLEYHLLRACGLSDEHLVVDVGCGSGRLAYQLAPLSRMRYVGCDVVPKLTEYALALCNRPDWRFEHTHGTLIPCADAEADFTCFFSVFTHLGQEAIFRYFREAHRVLRPGGLLVMSFLELRLPTHWAIFMASVNGTRDEEHLNQFIDREAIYTWADYAGFDVRQIYAGNTEYIPLPETICFEDGTRMTGAGSLGQSVAVLQKRAVVAQETPLHSIAVQTGASPESHPLPLYSLPPTSPNAPILNASARFHVTAERAGMLGFTLGGSLRRQVLIRAVGPALNAFGIPHILKRPSLKVVADGVEQARNSGGWDDATIIIAASGLVGAFPLPRGSTDAVLVLELCPGRYTAVVVSEETADEGEVLVEVYLVE